MFALFPHYTSCPPPLGLAFPSVHQVPENPRAWAGRIVRFWTRWHWGESAGEEAIQTRFHLALEQLPPPTNYRSRSSSQGTSIYGGCPICLEDFEEGESCQVIPECNHIFHWPCIEEWLMENQTCPVCRRLLLPRKEAFKFPIPSYWSVMYMQVCRSSKKTKTKEECALHYWETMNTTLILLWCWKF